MTFIRKHLYKVVLGMTAIASISAVHAPQVILPTLGLGLLTCLERRRSEQISATCSHYQQQNNQLAGQIQTLVAELSQQTARVQKDQEQIHHLQLQQQNLRTQLQPLTRLKQRLEIVQQVNDDPHSSLLIQSSSVIADQSEQRGRLAIFIDGANLERSTRQLGFGSIRYRELRELMRQGSTSTDYCYLPVGDGQVRKLSYLRRQGFRVLTRHITRQPEGKQKANQDVELAFNLLSLALEERFDTAILVAGDGDYSHAVRVLQHLGHRVEVWFWQAHTSRELSSITDRFVSLEEVREQITRLSHFPPLPPPTDDSNPLAG